MAFDQHFIANTYDYIFYIYLDLDYSVDSKDVCMISLMLVKNTMYTPNETFS